MTIAPQALGSLAAIVVILFLTCVFQWWQNRVHKINTSTLKSLKSDIEYETDRFIKIQEGYAEVLKNHNEIEAQIERLNDAFYSAQERTKFAQDYAEKELQLQIERLKNQYAASLDEELQRLKDSHELTKTQEQLGDLNAQISDARRTISIIQKQSLEAEKEDFSQIHSIEMSEPEKADIALLREFGPQIARRDAVNKLIWTEYYQRPLQNLRKLLEVDKKTGIYMIKEHETGRMYIGQAVNIGERWAEHVKTALGIGGTSYQTNKFYRAMHDKGPENFSFSVLQLCDAKDLNAREKYWIEFYNAASFGYNTQAGG